VSADTNPSGPPEGGVRLDTDLAGIHMKTPVMVASGTFGYGAEYAPVVDLNRLGAIVVKGISLEPWEGNPPPRLVEVPGGLVNAIGLQNPGVRGFCETYLPFLRQYDVPVIVNIWGRTVDEYAEVAARLTDVPGIHGLELNVSCPNLKEGGIAFGTDLGALGAVTAAVRRRTRLPIMPKLPPNVPRIGAFARVAEQNGADAVSLINSLPAMVVDIETRRPVLANVTGGLTGPAIHPVAVRLVYEAAGAVSIPVVAMGGIVTAREAIEFLIVGASAVAVGTANFTDPLTALTVADGIARYLETHGLRTPRDLVGTLVP
jgi:dihydroorotate dehydrogenase (NAD+) catalytic subunit